MHPVWAARRLPVYLAAWAPVLALLVYVTSATGAMPWRAASMVLAPACLFYAFVCLSPWYICGTLLLRASNWPSLVLTWCAAAMSGSVLFTGAAMLAAVALGALRPLSNLLPPLFGMGMLLYLLSAGLHYAALSIETARTAERRSAEARALAREAELQALRLQINPHFLFNSLHSIAALATMDGARAREMCVRLADFLRSSLGFGGRESIPLSEELALARSYLEVEQVRFGERLRVEAEVEPGCEGCAVPALLLQPLVENAVKHGIAGLVEGGSIRLQAVRRGAAVAITVENGFDPETPAPRSLGTGLTHVRRRLQVRYGEDATFDAGPHDGVYRVSLRFPCESLIASSSLA